MHELSRYLFLAGAAPYLLLGTAHALATPLRPGHHTGVSPADPNLAEAMLTSPLRLTRRTNMWLAWVGFNFSHSLGVLLLGVVVLLAGRSTDVFLAQAPLYLPLALLVAGVYVLLAIKYWFRTPIIGTALSFFLFLLSGIVFLLG
jgi:hypothetical protein